MKMLVRQLNVIGLSIFPTAKQLNVINPGCKPGDNKNGLDNDPEGIE